MSETKTGNGLNVSIRDASIPTDGVLIGGNNIQTGVMVPGTIVNALRLMGIELRHGQKDLPPEAVALLKGFGIVLPESIKEISTNVQYSSDTRKIILPTGMDKMTASKELKKQYENEEQLIDQIAQFEGWNWKDTLVAIKKVTESTFGWMNAQTVQSFFGPIRPKEIDIVIDVKEGRNITEKAFYGQFGITAWEDATANVNISGGEVQMKIEGKRKYSAEITRYFEEIRNHLETKSIYRGKSLVVTYDKDKNLDFEIIENKGSDKIILNRREELVVDQFIINGLGESGKRTYLFTGKYGTGKTESVMRIGREGTRRGMSFFYVKNAGAFDVLLNQSKKYQPCIVFVEDIDEIASGEERSAGMNEILNTLDGVQTKGNNLTVIFTTNHIERLNSAVRRPGRIDLILEFQFPDKEAQEKIYKAYFDDLPGSESIDYEDVLKNTPDIQGAVIAEICKRSIKLAQRDGKITTDNIVAAITSMDYQIKIMSESAETINEAEMFVQLYNKLIHGKEWTDLNDRIGIK